MVPQVQALGALGEDLGLVLSTSLVTPVSGDLTPSSGLCRHCTHLVHRQTSRHIDIIINKWGFYLLFLSSKLFCNG